MGLVTTFYFTARQFIKLCTIKFALLEKLSHLITRFNDYFQIQDSDSDTSDTEQDIRGKVAKAQSQQLAALLRQVQGVPSSGMTSFDSMAAQIAAFTSLGSLQPGLAPFYPGNLSSSVDL